MRALLLLIACFLVFSQTQALCQPNSTSNEPAPKSAWGTYGMLINNTAGNSSQQNPQIISDGLGNYVMVWEDGRNGNYSIYAQKVSNAGLSLWNKNGIPVCIASGNQNCALIAVDGNGGSIIVWQDFRNGNADVFAQKLGKNGERLWGENGVAVCAAPAGQFAPALIPDGTGGAYITWHDYRNKEGEDIFAQRIGNEGKALWQKDGVPVCVANGTQWYPRIVSDGKDNAVVIWSDGRNGPSNNDIYAQKISLDGKTLWKENGIAVCSSGNNQERPNAVFSYDGIVVVWDETRSGSQALFAQKISPDGALKWSPDGVSLCSAPFSQSESNLAADGLGGAMLTWCDERNGESDIYIQKINSDGRIALEESGRYICKADGKQKAPKITRLAGDDFAIFWQDDRSGQTDIFAQRINSSGVTLWKKNGVILAAGRLIQEAVCVAAGNSGSMVAVWQDARFGNTDIYCQKLDASGNLVWGKSGFLVSNAIGSVVQQNVQIIDNGKDEIILIFEDERSGFFNIYAQKINQAGKPAWGKEGIAVSLATAFQSNASLIPDGKGGAFIAFEERDFSNSSSIRLQHLSINGQRLWPQSLAVAKIKSHQIAPRMASDNAGGAILAWQDDRTAINLQDIFGQRVSATGKLLWGNNGKTIVAAAGEQTDLDMVADGAGGAFLTWTDYRNSDRNPDIYAQRVNPSGDPLWPEDGALVCGAPDIQRNSKIIMDNEGGILVAWSDKGSGNYDIYAQRLSKDGKTLWMNDGIPINQFSRTQQNPILGSANTLVWEDYRFGNWDIYAGKVSLNGKLDWGEDGKPITIMPHTQYSPQVTPWENNSLILSWEDYRDEKQYEIYIQKINGSGEPAWQENGLKIDSPNGARAAKILSNPSAGSFYVFWEDYSGGGRAIYGQKYLTN